MDQDAVRELARRIVERVAPGEAGEFDTWADAWFADPDRAWHGDAGRRDPLGAGLDTAVVSIAPFALWVADRVLSVLAEAGIKEGGGRVLGKFRRPKQQQDAGVSAEPVRSELGSGSGPGFDVSAVILAYGGDLEAVRAAALAAGEAFGADPEQARATAEVVVLVLTAQGSQGPDSPSA